MTWQQAKAQWRGSDYSAAGLNKGEIYAIRYQITSERTIEVKIESQPGQPVWRYANLAAFGKSWKVQPGA